MSEPKKSFGRNIFSRLQGGLFALGLAVGMVGCASAPPPMMSARNGADVPMTYAEGQVEASDRANASDARSSIVAATLEGEAEHPAAITIYGVEWCGPCHQAAAFLARRGVPFVERNIEGDRDAQVEMRTKLERAGLHPGAIPVIDVNGTILIGFNPGAVAKALRL